MVHELKTGSRVTRTGGSSATGLPLTEVVDEFLEEAYDYAGERGLVRTNPAERVAMVLISQTL